MLKITNTLVGCVLLTACQQAETSPTIPDFQVKGDTVQVDTSSGLYKKLTTEAISQSDNFQHFNTVGVVEIPPSQEAAIGPFFQGIVQRIYVQLGQQVKVGDPLFSLRAPAFIALQRAYLEAKSEFATATKHYKRQQLMLAKELIAQRSFEEANLSYELARVNLEQHIAELKSYQVDVTKLVLGQPYIIRAPIAGEVIEQKLSHGALLTEDLASLIRIASLKKVWITAQIKEQDIPTIARLKESSISLAPGYAAALGFPADSELPLLLEYVQPELASENRSASLLLACDNNLGLLKPGMFVPLTFSMPKVHALAVPETALQQGDEQTYVYVEGREKGTFIKRSIQLGAKLAAEGTSFTARYTIAAGLDTGERVLTKGGFYFHK